MISGLEVDPFGVSCFEPFSSENVEALLLEDVEHFWENRTPWMKVPIVPHPIPWPLTPQECPCPWIPLREGESCLFASGLLASCPLFGHHGP